MIEDCHRRFRDDELVEELITLLEKHVSEADMQRGTQVWEIFVCTAGCACTNAFDCPLLSWCATPLIRFKRPPHSSTCRAVVRVLAWVTRERRLSHRGSYEDGVRTLVPEGVGILSEKSPSRWPVVFRSGKNQLPSTGMPLLVG